MYRSFEQPEHVGTIHDLVSTSLERDLYHLPDVQPEDTTKLDAEHEEWTRVCADAIKASRVLEHVVQTADHPEHVLDIVKRLPEEYSFNAPLLRAEIIHSAFIETAMHEINTHWGELTRIESPPLQEALSRYHELGGNIALRREELASGRLDILFEHLPVRGINRPDAWMIMLKQVREHVHQLQEPARQYSALVERSQTGTKAQASQFQNFLSLCSASARAIQGINKVLNIGPIYPKSSQAGQILGVAGFAVNLERPPDYTGVRPSEESLLPQNRINPGDLAYLTLGEIETRAQGYHEQIHQAARESESVQTRQNFDLLARPQEVAGWGTRLSHNIESHLRGTRALENTRITTDEARKRAQETIPPPEHSAQLALANRLLEADTKLNTPEARARLQADASLAPQVLVDARTTITLEEARSRCQADPDLAAQVLVDARIPLSDAEILQRMQSGHEVLHEAARREAVEELIGMRLALDNASASILLRSSHADLLERHQIDTYKRNALTEKSINNQEAIARLNDPLQRELTIDSAAQHLLDTHEPITLSEAQARLNSSDALVREAAVQDALTYLTTHISLTRAEALERARQESAVQYEQALQNEAHRIRNEKVTFAESLQRGRDRFIRQTFVQTGQARDLASAERGLREGTLSTSEEVQRTLKAFDLLSALDKLSRSGSDLLSEARKSFQDQSPQLAETLKSAVASLQDHQEQVFNTLQQMRADRTAGSTSDEQLIELVKGLQNVEVDLRGSLQQSTQTAKQIATLMQDIHIERTEALKQNMQDLYNELTGEMARKGNTWAGVGIVALMGVVGAVLTSAIGIGIFELEKRAI